MDPIALVITQLVFTNHEMVSIAIEQFGAIPLFHLQAQDTLAQQNTISAGALSVIRSQMLLRL